MPHNPAVVRGRMPNCSRCQRKKSSAAMTRHKTPIMARLIFSASAKPDGRVVATGSFYVVPARAANQILKESSGEFTSLGWGGVQIRTTHLAGDELTPNESGSLFMAAHELERHDQLIGDSPPPEPSDVAGGGGGSSSNAASSSAFFMFR